MSKLKPIEITAAQMKVYLKGKRAVNRYLQRAMAVASGVGIKVKCHIEWPHYVVAGDVPRATIIDEIRSTKGKSNAPLHG